MRIRRGHTYKLFRETKTKVINVTTALIMVASSLGGALPILLSGKAFAATTTVCATGCDFTSIQSAIDAAGSGDTVSIGAGTYTETGINLNKSVSLVSAAGAEIDVPDAAVVNAINITANNATVSGLTIVGPASTSYKTYPWGGNVTRGIVVANGVTNFSITGNTIKNLRNDVLVDGRNTGSITNNVIDNSKSGISIQYTDGSGITITGNSEGTFGNDWGVNTHLNGHVLSDGVSVDGNNADKIATNAPTVAQQVVKDLSSNNSNWTVQDQGYSTSNRTTVQVSNTGTATAQGDPLGPISTVQIGVNAVVAGGAVTVAAGTYTESVTISSPVKINGAQYGQDARGRTSAAESVVNGNITINADNVTVDGFTVNGTANSAAFTTLNHNNNQVIYNTIINVGANSAAISYNSSGDTFSHNQVNMSSSAYSGIQANSVPLGNTQIVGNAFAGSAPNADADINFIGDATTHITDLLVQDNTSDNTSGTLVAVFNADRVNISGNTAQNEAGSVVYVGGGVHTVTVTGNTLTGGGTAVNVENDFGDGINSNVTATHNNLADSTNGVKVGSSAYTNGATVDATSNWWGAANGPHDSIGGDGSILDTNAGSGSAAIGAVKYASWCANLACTLLGPDTTAPAVPSLTSPSDGATVKANDATLNWTDVTDPDGSNPVTYEYQSSYDSSVNGTNNALNNVIYHTSTGTASQIDATGSADATYYWQVRACDSVGNCSNWSGPWKVTIDSTAPAIPTLQFPANGVYRHSADTNHSDWSTVTDPDGPVTYYYESAYDSAFTNIAYGPHAQSATTILNPNEPEVTYYWRVQACDALGNCSAWSQPRTIHIDNSAPVVAITAPHNGDTVHGTITVSGTVTDLNPDHYYFVVKDHNGNVVAGPGTVNQATVSDWSWNTTNVSDGTYTVDLEARDKADNKDAGSVQTIAITVDNAVPATPTGLGFLQNGLACGSSTNVNFISPKWNAVTGAVSYNYTVTLGGNVIVPPTNVGNVTTLSGPFGGQGLSTFSVQAVGANGFTSGWATPCAITYDATAPVVAVNTLSTTDTTPTVTGTVDDSSATVTVKVNGHTYNATVSGNTWSADVTDALAVNTYDVVATATDAAGNVGTDGTTNELTITAPPVSSTTTTFTNVSRQLAITGNANNNGTTTGGNATTGNTTNDNSAVLGTSTGSTGKVKGDSTVNLKNASTKKDGNFLMFGWWWLAIIAVIGAFWFLLAARRRNNED